MTKIAINGFGRIGRLFFRQAFATEDIEIVAINDLGNLENLAYLLKYDTVYRIFDKEIKTDGENLIVDNKKIKFFQIKEPADLPWGRLGVDIVIESTGVFESYEKASIHLKAGAKKVILSAPAKDADGITGQTVLCGINEEKITACNITSNGSCTTNAVAPIIATLTENPGIEKAMLNTIHSYTATQSIVDSPVKGNDFRRGRAAAQNIIPSTTGAALSVTRVIKEINGRFDGIAIRVPSITGSIADITFLAKRNVTAEEINDVLRKAANSPRFKNILSVSDEPLVSADIIGSPYASIVDAQFTKVVGGNFVKVLAWYDNEAGYVSTLLAHTALVAKNIK